MSEQKLIWVDKDLAEQYEKLNSDIEKSKFVNQLIKDRKLDITGDIENLNDDLLRFKAFALNYKTEFEKVYWDQNEKMEKFFNENGYIFDKISSKTMQLKEEVSKIGNQIKQLNDQLQELNTYKIERLIELVTKYNNMSDEDKRIFEIVLKSQN